MRIDFAPLGNRSTFFAKSTRTLATSRPARQSVGFPGNVLAEAQGCVSDPFHRLVVYLDARATSHTCFEPTRNDPLQAEIPNLARSPLTPVALLRGGEARTTSASLLGNIDESDDTVAGAGAMLVAKHGGGGYRRCHAALQFMTTGSGNAAVGAPAQRRV